MIHYDVVIIGGGIHGAGVAQAAAAAGYSVLVLEHTALASGTSSRSSKLIHGGLRYLESAQYGLVKECLRERALLLKLAPDLVKLQPFYIPIYANTQRRPWQIRAGLTLYSLLGGLSRDTRFSKVPRRNWDSLDGIKREGLQVVYRYYDGQTDDVALTRAVMASAQRLDAVLEMPAEFISARPHKQGCSIEYSHSGKTKRCSAKVLVNAAGPWVNQVLGRVDSSLNKVAVELVQGTHLVLEGKVSQGIYYMEAPQDQRAVFAIPWKGNTMVGTTETLYQGAPSQVAPLQSEVEYLQNVLAHYFPERFSLQQQRVIEKFAGLRVLPVGSGSAFSRPRDTLLEVDNEETPKILSIYGGKLTAYRITAQRVLQRIQPSLPQRKIRAEVTKLHLYPAEG